MNDSKQPEISGLPVLDPPAIERALRRIAHEIIERNPELDRLVLAGIPARGNEIAQRIAGFISAIEQKQIATGVIDVAMHRDDVGTRPELPVVRASQLPLPLEVHRHEGEPCPRCGTTIAAVHYESYVLCYCPQDQTGRKVLKDRRLSRLLK